MAGTVGVELVDRLQHATMGDLAPDLTLILDVPVEIGLARRGTSAANRFEHKGQAFHQRVRDGFLELAAREPSRCRVIDGARDADTVARDIRAAVGARFALDLASAD
jgi:dTMP kinase